MNSNYIKIIEHFEKSKRGYVIQKQSQKWGIFYNCMYYDEKGKAHYHKSNTLDNLVFNLLIELDLEYEK